MIRTLYARMAIVILVVVWFSLALSSLVFSRYYHNQFSGRVEELQLRSANLVIRLIQETEPQQIGQAVSIAARISRGQHLALYSETGERYLSSGRAECSDIRGEIVDQVLGGAAYSSVADPEESSCERGSVGVPFEYGGKRYALFVLPGPPPERGFDGADVRNLAAMLLISTIIILLAAVYLVRPLKQITKATHRIAGGDFDVKLDIRQKDELGELAASINHMAGELKKIEQMRQEFVSNVSHDLQTPLTSIRGFSKLLQQDGLDPAERLDYLQRIENESERLSRLSENLLKLASLDSEHHPLHLQPIALDEQLRRIVVASEPLWSAKRLELELELDSVQIVGDEDSLNQVWANLLHNAVKFTPEGGRISIELAEGIDGVTVTVSDSGIGISAEDLPHIFRRFYKADASRNQAQGNGSGLGLAIARKIVELHGGSVELSSEPGQGTKARVTLPRR